jgi:hypothetical protein
MRKVQRDGRPVSLDELERERAAVKPPEGYSVEICLEDGEFKGFRAVCGLWESGLFAEATAASKASYSRAREVGDLPSDQGERAGGPIR